LKPGPASKITNALLGALLSLCLLPCQTVSAQTPAKRELAEVESLIGDGRLTEAESVLSSLVSRYPGDADVHLRYAAVLRSLGENALAVKEYERAASLNSELIEPLIALSELDLQNLDIQNALKYGRLAINAAPKSVPARITLVRTLMQSDRMSEAERELAPLLQQNNNDPQVLVLAYQIKTKRGDFTSAMSYLNMAIKRQPDDLDLKLELSSLLENSGEHLKAREQLRKILELDPNSIAAREKLARNLEVFSHDYEGAMALYSQILKINPDSTAAITGLERCRGKRNNLSLRLKWAWQSMFEKPGDKR
jgi:tetratricopeptide (TPR) repeat protein